MDLKAFEYEVVACRTKRMVRTTEGYYFVGEMETEAPYTPNHKPKEYMKSLWLSPRSYGWLRRLSVGKDG